MNNKKTKLTIVVANNNIDTLKNYPGISDDTILLDMGPRKAISVVVDLSSIDDLLEKDYVLSHNYNGPPKKIISRILRK